MASFGFMIKGIDNDMGFGGSCSSSSSSTASSSTVLLLAQGFQGRLNGFQRSSHGTRHDSHGMRRLIFQMGDHVGSQFLGLLVAFAGQAGIGIAIGFDVMKPTWFVKFGRAAPINVTGISVDFIVVALGVTNQADGYGRPDSGFRNRRLVFFGGRFSGHA
jgi:hypothetical protein